MKIAVDIDHNRSLAAFTAAGHPFPAIPQGNNTIWHHFVTVHGDHAVILNQTGIAPIASDDEQQNNGCTLAIALDPPDAATARATLEKWVREMLEIK